MSANQPDTRALARLLQSLAEPGACAARSELDVDATLIVRAPKNGITMVRTRVAARIGDAAVSDGLAAWSREAAPRLHITVAGRAWLRRAAAPAVADPFHAQHAEYERRPLEKGAPPTLINAAESPLVWLARRRDREGRPFLSAAQIEAGERLRRDFEQAGLLQRVTANWEAQGGSAPWRVNRGDVSQVAIDARRRIARAADAVGPANARVLIEVCGYLKGLAIVEREYGLKRRTGKLALRTGLDALAKHYGVGDQATGAPAKGVVQWGAEDYRPRM